MGDVVLGFGNPTETDASVVGNTWFKTFETGHRSVTILTVGQIVEIMIGDARFITNGKHWTVSRDVFGLVPIRYHFREKSLWLSTRPDVFDGTINSSRLTGFLLQSRDDGIDDFFDGVFRIRPNETVVFTADSVASRQTRELLSFAPVSRSLDETVQGLIDALDLVAPKYDFALALSGGLDSNAFSQSDSRIEPYTMQSKFPSVNETKFVTAVCAQNNLTPNWFDIDAVYPLKKPDYFSAPEVVGWGPSFHANAYGEFEFFSHIAATTDLPIVTGLAGDHVLDVNAPIVARRAIQTGDIRLLNRLRRYFPKTVVRQLLTTPVSRLSRRMASDPYATWVIGNEEPRFTDQQNWASVRWSQLRTWRWERVTRLTDSHARMIGRPMYHPWLSIYLWRFLLSVEPKHLFADFQLKGLLRRALIGRIPERVRIAPKTKSLNKVVEFGLGIERPDFVRDQFAKSQLEDRSLIDGLAFRSAFDGFVDHCHRAGDDEWVPTFPIWQTIAAELWLQSLK